MAKRSNNSRNKKLQASKPYDISNSFVKKVASRVTEFLPQSLWPTKWFSSTTSEAYSPSDGRKLLNSPHVLSNLDVTEEIASSRTARLPLDSNLNDPLFDASISTSDFKGRRLKNSIVASSEDVEDGEAVAGPSGIHKNFSPRKTIREKQKSREGFCYNARQLEVNGEDHSDSSESTSGCSSLPQMDSNTDVRSNNQAMSDEIQSSCPQPITRHGAKRRRQEEPLYSSVNNPSLLPSLENFTSPGRTVPVGRRRNPSFNPDIFGPQSWCGEKTNIKDRIVNSPFYSGRTTYGGISAYQNHLSRSSNQETSGLRSIRVHPVKTSEAKGDAAAGMSNTARRILEALEMFSSPIQDAKKIPLSGSMNIKRRKILSNVDTSQRPANSPSSSATSLGANNSLGDFTPTVKELIVPTVPDILALRRRQKLQGSTVAAREVANETNALPFGGEKVPFNLGYWSSEKSGGGKIRSKKEIDEETVEKPNLPNVSLPITSLPKFDLILSTDLPSHSQKQTNSSKFKFSSPIAVTSVSESFVISNKFTFSSPQKATERDSRSIGPRTDMLRTVESVPKKSENLNENVAADRITSKTLEIERLEKRGLESNSDYKLSSKGVLSQNVAQHRQMNSNVLLDSKKFSGKNTLMEDSKSITNFSKCERGKTQKNSQISLSLGSEACINVKEKVDSSKATNIMAETKSGFGDQFKPPSGSWSCDVCMISNPSDKSKCLACETPRSGFGDKFKPPSGSWSCDVCMISNPSDQSKCLACETPRKSSETGAASVSVETKSTSSGFGKQFKKPDGAWDCTICLVRNKAGGPPKCVACEAPKPGSESLAVKSEPTGSNKFSLGSSVNSGFQFGIDKAGNLPKSSTDSKPSFTFGSSTTTTSTAAFGGSSFSTGFTFGVKPEGGTKDSGFTFGIATTKESSEVDGPKNPVVSQSSSLFGKSESQTKSSTAEIAKLPPTAERVEIIEKSDTKTPKAEENKLGGFSNPATSTDDKVALKTSIDAKVKFNTQTPPSSESEVKSAFSFVSPEGKPSILNKDSSLSNGKWKIEVKPSNNAAESGSAIFNTTTTVASWNFTLPTNTSQSSPFSSPKTSYFPQVSASTVSVSTDSVKKQEETTKPSAPDFKFGDTSKFEFTIPAAKAKSQEVPATSSSGFKFQEIPKSSSPFSMDDKVKTTSSIVTNITSNPISSNAFKSAVTAESISGKPLVTSEKPSTLPAPSLPDSSAVLKSNNSGPVFMFGSETSSAGTAFNSAGQKPFVQAGKDEAPKLFSNIGASSGSFNLGKSSTFGSVTSSPSLATAPSLPAPDTRPPAGSLFASPSSNPVFGSSTTTAVTTSSASTTTAVSTAPSAFGSSIFNQPFPTVSTSSVSFGSPSAAFGASTSVFGSNTTPSTTPFSFSGSAKPAAEEQPTQPAPFVFGSNTNQSSQPFTFGASANKPAFGFGRSTQPVAGTSGQAPALPSAPALGVFSFGDASKSGSPFGSVHPPTSAVGGTSNPFGSSNPNPPSFGAPSLGEANPAVTAAFGTSAFNFGSAQSNPTFSFGANQSTNLQSNLTQPSGFNFGQVSQTGSAPPAVAPQFNPNLPPSFNFTNGATPQFTATPAGLNVPPSANTMQRRFKKAVRRTTQPR